jgi:hypothetical protein
MTSLGLYILSLLLFAFPPGGAGETREEGARRYEVIAQALADASLHQGAAWDRGPADLGRAIVAAGGYGMGFGVGVQTGAVRGKAGEVCHVDILPSTLRTVVPWDLSRLPEAELVSKVVGLDYGSMRRCFDAGALLMVRIDREAKRRCKSEPLDLAVFALFARNTCSTRDAGGEDSIARPRFQLYLRLRARKHTIFPDWYEAPEVRRSA